MAGSPRERTFTASIATVWDGETPRDRVAIDLGDARLPEPAMVALANGVRERGEGRSGSPHR